MKGPALVGTLVLVAAVGFGAGWYIHQQKETVHKETEHAEHMEAVHPKAATITTVVIAIKADHTCAQLNSHGGFAKIPPLSISNGDSMTWLKGIDAQGHEAPLVVTFPPMSNTHIGSPFVDGSGAAKFIFHNGDNSRPPASNAAEDAYLYFSATVGGIACSNPQDPGVIIER